MFIKLESRGPALFKQKRLGAQLSAILFLIIFARRMWSRPDPLGQQARSAAGTKKELQTGSQLGFTSLDELLQFIDVFRGVMLLVYRRPHPLAASAAGIAYARAISEYPIRHRVKPGITGWAQVNGWRGETTTIEQIQRRVEHDLYYVDNWSLTFLIS